MKRSAVILGILFSVAVRASASESFLVTVPVREDPTRQTGEVKITLGLDAPPAGSQLVINETATVNLGQTVNVGGEPVTYEAGIGNSARILYKPLQNFPTPGNFCASPGIQRELQVRFVGSQDIVDYRISSYSVGAPEFECSKPFKRVGDFPAFMTPFADATTPELVALNKARHELDVVLVLDKSGSMAGFPPGFETGPSKAEILRSAVKTFIAQWREIDATQADNPGVEFFADRIGLVFFDSTAVPQSVDNAFFVERGPDSPPPHQWDAVINHVDTLQPGSLTSVGGGINTAMEQWLADPDHDLTVILVTDGIQNTAPLVETVDVGGEPIATLAPVGSFGAELRKRSVPIFTIGFGIPSGVDEALLQQIATQTTGQIFIAVDSSTLFANFGQTLVNFLKGNTISTPLRRTETMSGLGPSAAHPLLVDDSVSRVVVSVQWAPPLRDVLDLEVTGPGGAALTPATVSRIGQAVIHRFDLRPGDSGDWTVRVTRGQSSATQTIPYVLNAFVVEKDLEYAVSIDQAEPATGDRIKIRARVAFANKSLDKLPAGAIRVRVHRPAEGLGNILRSAEAGGDGAANPDVQSPYHRKVAEVVNASVLQRVYPRDVAEVILQEESPGVYSGTFDDTGVPGLYVFETTLDWQDKRTGRIHREERLEKHVKVRPDPVATIVTTRRGDADRVLVAVTPRDRFGNFTGPGYGSRVKATSNIGTISSEATDPDQTGTYTFVVTDVPAGKTPDVDVTVDGVDINPAASTGRWRVFFDIGANFPHGGFSPSVEGELSVNGGIERVLSPNWSLELILGHHGYSHIFESRIAQLSIGGKYWFGSSALRPFVGASAGGYYLDPRDETRFGWNAGAGLLYQLTPNLGVEGIYNVHNINTQGDSLTFSTVQAGVRVSW